METTSLYIDHIARAIELVGICTIIIGMLMAFTRYLYGKERNEGAYTQLRQRLGKSILLGLEVLVAGDIIGTVVSDATMERVLVLGVIVIIRTVLSLSIQVEIEGRFPWQRSQHN